MSALGEMQRRSDEFARSIFRERDVLARFAHRLTRPGGYAEDLVADVALAYRGIERSEFAPDDNGAR